MVKERPSWSIERLPPIGLEALLCAQIDGSRLKQQNRLALYVLVRLPIARGDRIAPAVAVDIDPGYVDDVFLAPLSIEFFDPVFEVRHIP